MLIRDRDEEVRSQLSRVAVDRLRLRVCIGARFETVQDIEVADEATVNEVVAWFVHDDSDGAGPCYGSW